MPTRGLDAAQVLDAIDAGQPFPGGRGFGGTVEGRLVTDVLGRVPVYLDVDAEDVDPDTTGAGWAFDPTVLERPTVLPAGHELDFRTWEPGSGIDAATRWATLPESAPLNDEAVAIERLGDALDETLARTPDAPVGFSGGVDSSALTTVSSGPLYVAGLPGSHDLDAARVGAEWLGRPVETVELTPESIAEAVPRVARAIGRTNPMDVAIALPIWAVATRVAEDGHERLLLGQGADELFGGYEKVADAPSDPRVEAETIDGARRELIETLPRQLERDVRTLRSADIEPIIPYLDDRMIEAALALPPTALVDDRGTRKRALRLAARSLVPDHVAFAEKTAVQYGSDVTDELDRLARDAGFKPRRENHVESYVRCRLRGSFGTDHVA